MVRPLRRRTATVPVCALFAVLVMLSASFCGSAQAHRPAGVDFNRDGVSDLVLQDGGGTTASPTGFLKVLLGNISRFELPSPFRSGIGASTWQGVGDFNHDGVGDVALLSGNGQLDLLLSDGSQFQYLSAALTNVGAFNWIQVGDFNRDGIDDLALQRGSSIDVALGNGTRFGAPTTWRTGIGPSRWQGVGDFNRDGISDIALQNGADIDVLLGNMSQFEYAGHWRGGVGAFRWAVVGDFNRDNIDDIAMQTDANVDVLLGNLTRFEYAGHWRGGIGATDWAGVGDFNHDGIDDLALHGPGSSFGVLPGNMDHFEYAGVWRSGIDPFPWAGPGNFAIDQTNPTAALSGGLYDARTAASLTNGALVVSANDDLSGVVSIKLYDHHADGSRTLVAQQTRACWTRNCPTAPLSLSTALDPTALGWTTGAHQLDVEVTDNAHNTATTSWSVTYYPTSWVYGGANHVVDGDVEAQPLIGALSAGDGANAEGLLNGLSPGENAWIKNNYLLFPLPGGPSPSGPDEPSSAATDPADALIAATDLPCQKEQNFKLGMYTRVNYEPLVELRWDVKYCWSTNGTIHHVKTIFQGTAIGGGWKPVGSLQVGGGWEGDHAAYRRTLQQGFELCGGANAGVNIAGTGFELGSDGCLTGTLKLDRTIYFGRLWHTNADDSTNLGIKDRSSPVGPCRGGTCRS
jgi:hypothetical protein